MQDTLRQQARARLADLVACLKRTEPVAGFDALVEEAKALDRAIDAYHMEAIRFRMFNVDRMLRLHPGGVPAEAVSLFGDVRRSLEAAGFHTRSH